MGDNREDSSARAHTIIPALIPVPAVEVYVPPANTKTGKLFSLRLGDVKQLTGQDNYSAWMAVMTRMLQAMRLHDITVDGVKPQEKDTVEAFTAYNQQDNSAATAILQIISNDILSQISEFETSHAMWTSLKQQYLRE